MSDFMDEAKKALDQLQEKAAPVLDKVKTGATEAFEKVKTEAVEAYEKAKPTLEKVKDGAVDTFEKAKEGATEAFAKAKDKLEEIQDAVDPTPTAPHVHNELFDELEAQAKQAKEAVKSKADDMQSVLESLMYGKKPEPMDNNDGEDGMEE